MHQEILPGGSAIGAGESVGGSLSGEGALDDDVLQGRNVNVAVEAQSHVKGLIALVNDDHVPLQTVGCTSSRRLHQE